MRGIQISQYVKGPAELKVTDLPDPVPSDDEYLIRVDAAAANFFDILQVQAFPWVAGAEFAGTVISPPRSSKSPAFPQGSRVFGASQGAFASTVCAKEVSLLPVPEGWSAEEAAGLFVTAPTSYGALVVRAGIKKGDWVLVHAAAGGVGLAAVQGQSRSSRITVMKGGPWALNQRSRNSSLLPGNADFTRIVAKAFGATVIATASSQLKLDVAKSFGADHVVSYSDETWPAKIKALTPGSRGVDIVYDPVGMVDKSTKCCAWNARILVVGFAAGSIEKVAMNKVLLKNISLVGIHWGAYAKNEKETIPKVWKGIMDLVQRGQMRGTEYTDEEFKGLDRVKDALVALGSRNTWGKVVIKLSERADSKL